MAKSESQTLVVRMERISSYRAVERMREAYRQLSKKASWAEESHPIQEVEHEPIGSSLCESINSAARTGSHDG